MPDEDKNFGGSLFLMTSRAYALFRKLIRLLFSPLSEEFEGTARYKMASKADFIFYGGDIITMNETNPSAEALAVKDDIIVAVGKLDEVFSLAGPST